MFPPPLDRRQALQFALWLCIPSSVINLSIFLITHLRPTWIPSARDLVGITAMGVTFGLVKALFISAIACQFKPTWRRPMILGSVIVLTLLEGFILDVLLNFGIAVG